MKALTFIVCCAIALQGYSQVLCKWTADASSATAAEFQCYRGETLQLQPTLKQYGVVVSNATYTLQWQTNGMGTAYWSTNILQFTPAMDVGANAYTVFIRAETTNGVSYRANAKIRMLGSPGLTPNVLQLPVQTIDFSSTSYSNAPWLVAETDPGVPAAITSAVAQADTNAQASAAAAQSRAIAFASTNKTLRLFDPADVNRYIDGSGNKCVISNFWEITFGADFQNQYGYDPTNTTYLITAYGQNIHEHDVYMPGSRYWNIGYGPTYNMGNNDGFYVEFFPGGFYSNGWYPTTNQYVLNAAQQTGAQGTAYVRHYSTTNLIAALASQAEVVSATAGLVSTNETRHVRLNTLTVTNAITATDGTTSIIPRTRSLIDSSSVAAADWQNRYLYSSSGRLTLDWDSGILTAYHPVYGYSQSLDWINRALMDSDERTAMAWGDRNLQFPTAGVAIDWSIDNAVTINGGVSMPGSVLAETELHRDSFTNIIWRSVYSNGWMWLVAYTNYPAQ